MRDMEAEAKPGENLDFRELCREWRPRGAAYCRAFRGLSEQDREDAVEEALARVWRARDSYDPYRPFAPWFLTILRRVALDMAARGARGGQDGEDPDRLPSTMSGPEGEAVRNAESEFVRRFVAVLPERDRELASLVYGQGLGPSEAARIAGMPPGTAKWRLHEVRKALRKAWEEEYGV